MIPQLSCVTIPQPSSLAIPQPCVDDQGFSNMCAGLGFQIYGEGCLVSLCCGAGWPLGVLKCQVRLKGLALLVPMHGCMQPTCTQTAHTHPARQPTRTQAAHMHPGSPHAPRQLTRTHTTAHTHLSGHACMPAHLSPRPPRDPTLTVMIKLRPGPGKRKWSPNMLTCYKLYIFCFTNIKYPIIIFSTYVNNVT